ncbi:MAG: hypothetical protein U5K00_21540 [Melioribacteraceae bacterium]|nr:hypothetical protein [Melioribacteraceae bacterium]
MKASKIIFFLIMVTALFLTSCKEDSSNPTEPENGNGGTSGTSNPSGQAGFNYWFSESMAVQLRAGYYPYISAAILL